IAQKLDIPIYGVNLPQHFILTYEDESGLRVDDTNVLFDINVFNKGFILGRKDIDMFLRQLKIHAEKAYYEPCSNVDIIKRVIRNLISSYEELGSEEKANEIRQLLGVFS